MTISEEQCSAYYFAEYRVFAPMGTIVLPAMGTSKLGALHTSYGVDSSVLITAYNPGGVPSDLQMNIDRHNDLVKEVSKRWSFLSGEGADRERRHVEPSILILGISREDALALGRAYGQNAVLFGDETGKTQLLACHSEDQASLIHPFHRMMDQLHAKLRAAGREVTILEPSESGEMTVTFPANRSSEVIADDNTEKTVGNSTIVASADVDQIDGEMLEWSGLAELWDEHELCSRYTFIDDVVELCPSAWVDQRERGGEVPGQSGIWYEVTTKDPQQLKRELEAKVRELLDEDN